jgi:hypothetical protein
MLKSRSDEYFKVSHSESDVATGQLVVETNDGSAE